jgi:hypothetical protein
MSDLEAILGPLNILWWAARQNGMRLNNIGGGVTVGPVEDSTCCTCDATLTVAL